MSDEISSENPLAAADRWLNEAATGVPRRNPLAMGLATCSATGAPSLRMVLLKHFSQEHGFVVFYTNYDSRKGRELADNARAAAVLYWPEFGGRQLRFEGPIVRSPAAESDAYFATRPLASQLNAWVSAQSQPLTDPELLLIRYRDKAVELGVAARAAAAPQQADASLPRPQHWGGYRLWIDTLELWTEGSGRFHERRQFTRSLEPEGTFAFTAGSWRSLRLQP